MVLRTFGHISKGQHPKSNKPAWVLDKVEPHVCIRLKQVFPKIPKTDICPFYLEDNDENCFELLWFMRRFPFTVSDQDMQLMEQREQSRIDWINKSQEILSEKYQPKTFTLKNGKEGRHYQFIGSDLYYQVKRLLIGDDMGLGKTVTAILSMLQEGVLPAAVVVQPHLIYHWKEKIEEFTNLSVHIIKSRKNYILPAADVYIFRYTNISGWVDTFNAGLVKSSYFDEIQELRRAESDKYWAAQRLSDNSEYVMGMSGTPIYNYGDEIYNVMQIVKPGCLGTRYEFQTEWTHYRKTVADPKALGSYLRENKLFLRRTRAEVGRELPPVNTLIYPVDYDENEVEKHEQLAKMLAMKVLNSNDYLERGRAAAEFDLLVRQTTGISKAKAVAAMVKMVLDNGEPMILAGWHRRVYEIWAEELADYNPVFYTGTESPAQKLKSKEAFLNGESNLFIISLRSGIGLDGLQHRCNLVGFGELDWSPKVHDQVITRVDRDGQKEQVTAMYFVSEYGSDPPMMNVLGLKASQSQGIIDPFKGVTEQFSDESRVKKMAEQFLKNSLQK